MRRAGSEMTRHDHAKPLPFLRPPKPRWPTELLLGISMALAIFGAVCLWLAMVHGGGR